MDTPANISCDYCTSFLICIEDLTIILIYILVKITPNSTYCRMECMIPHGLLSIYFLQLLLWQPRSLKKESLLVRQNTPYQHNSKLSYIPSFQCTWWNTFPLESSELSKFDQPLINNMVFHYHCPTLFRNFLMRVQCLCEHPLCSILSSEPSFQSSES